MNSKKSKDVTIYKIYKLIYKGEVCYVGRTKGSLHKRKSAGYRRCCGGKLEPIRRDCTIELIEETTDVSRERWWINYYRDLGEPLLNINAGEGFDSYENYKIWRKNNEEHYRNYAKEYYQKNKEARRQYNRDNYKHNAVYSKKYYEENKETMDKSSIQYKKDNKDSWNIYQRIYKRMRYWKDKHEANPNDEAIKVTYEDLVLELKLLKESKYKR